MLRRYPSHYLSGRTGRPTQLCVWRVLPVVLSTGCLYVGWDDVPSAHVRAEVHEAYRANPTFDNASYWWGEVANAVAIWNAAARDAGCPEPFSMTPTEDAHPIRLVPRAAWPYAERTVGMYVDEYSDATGIGYIVIRERRPVAPSHLPVLLHELGHALGLTHDDAHDTVMFEETGDLAVPQPRDLERMRDALGC